ncbi:hypothetical protein ACERIM_01945 [Natrinema sp. H-ect1]|uniref:hypothetical protein n=1 Tax=Natrinema sp. H-ect1 TaxID=3242700 RepID=UPI00359EDF00
MTTNAHRRLNDALSEAKADIVRDHLLDDGGAGATVLHRLEADEKVQYLFKHSSKGIRIERPGEGEETPYNSHQRGTGTFWSPIGGCCSSPRRRGNRRRSTGRTRRSPRSR